MGELFHFHLRLTHKIQTSSLCESPGITLRIMFQESVLIPSMQTININLKCGSKGSKENTILGTKVVKWIVYSLRLSVLICRKRITTLTLLSVIL